MFSKTEKNSVWRRLLCSTSFRRNRKASLITRSPPASRRSKPALGRDAFLPLRDLFPVFSFFAWDFEPAVGGVRTGTKGESGLEAKEWPGESLVEDFKGVISLGKMQEILITPRLQAGKSAQK